VQQWRSIALAAQKQAERAAAAATCAASTADTFECVVRLSHVMLRILLRILSLAPGASMTTGCFAREEAQIIGSKLSSGVMLIALSLNHRHPACTAPMQ